MQSSLCLVNDLIVFSFDGALRLREVKNDNRAFTFEASFRPDHRLAPVIFNPSSKPPLHFHPYQDEYVKVLAGKGVVEVNGQEHILLPDDNEFCVRAWSHHRLYPTQCATSIPSEERQVSGETTLLISGQKVSQSFHEDMLFMENWYHYLNDIVMNNVKMDIIQLLSVSILQHHPLVNVGRSNPEIHGMSRCLTLEDPTFLSRHGFHSVDIYHELWA